MVPRVAGIIFPHDIDDDGRRQPVRIDLVETGEDDDEHGAQAEGATAPNPPIGFLTQRGRADSAAGGAGGGAGARAAAGAGVAPPAGGGLAAPPPSHGGARPGRRLEERPRVPPDAGSRELDVGIARLQLPSNVLQATAGDPALRAVVIASIGPELRAAVPDLVPHVDERDGRSNRGGAGAGPCRARRGQPRASGPAHGARASWWERPPQQDS